MDNNDLEIRPAASTTAVVANTGGNLARFRTAAEMTSELQRMAEFQGLWEQFLEKVLVKGSDYIKLPDCGDKVAVSKAGGEKVLKWHGLYADGFITAKKEDWELGLFAYSYRVEIKQVGTGIVVGAAEAECNTWEPKYRYRWVFDNEIPSNVDKGSLVTKTRKSRKPPHNEFIMYRLENPDPAGERNTVMKMAFKRAMVDAAIAATGIRAFVEALTDDDPGGDDDEPIGGAAQANAGPDGYKNLIKARYKSKFGEAGNLSLCNFCEKRHITAGDPIVMIEEANGKKKYGPEACLAERWATDHPMPQKGATAEAAADDSPQPEAAAQPRPETPAGAKLTVPQIKGVSDMIKKAEKTEAEFRGWLYKAFPKYAGKGINDIEQIDYELITQAWRGNLL